MKFGPIYKLTKNGKIQTWEIHVEGNAFYTIEGLLNGKQTRSSPTFCVAKNVGRSNETTPEMQAGREAESRYTRKLERGYTLNVDNVKAAKQDGYEPMTARKFSDLKDKITDECYVQPKFDGIRCIMMQDGAFTRNGKSIVTIPHIQKRLEPFFKEYPDAILDGELYNHELHDDFNKITSIIKKTKPTTEHLIESEKLAQYYVYDMPRLSKEFNESQVFTERNKKMHEVLGQYVYDKKIVLVSENKVSPEKDLESEVKRLHDVYVSKGFEGIMVRTNGPYEQKRSKTLLKYKVFDDEEFIVDDILPGLGGKAHMAARIILHTKEGYPFAAGLNGTNEYCEQVLIEKDRYIGKPATVRFFGYTPSEKSVPRFGKVIELDRIDNAK